MAGTPPRRAQTQWPHAAAGLEREDAHLRARWGPAAGSHWMHFWMSHVVNLQCSVAESVPTEGAASVMVFAVCGSIVGIDFEVYPSWMASPSIETCLSNFFLSPGKASCSAVATAF